MTPVPQLGSRLRPVGSAPEGPSTLVSRRNWPVLVFALVFASCILFAYCWFNTDIGRPSPGSAPYAARRASSLRFTSPGIWLTARTNLPGYTFVSEPVSDSVKETLGTTDIVSGTFYRTEDRKQMTEDRRLKPEPASDRARASSSVKSSTFDVQRSAFGMNHPNVPPTSAESVLRPPSSDLRNGPPSSDRITIFLATWSAESKKPLLMLGHTPDICWTGAGWKPVDLGQPRQVLIDLPLASRSTSDERPALDQPSGTGVHSGSRPSTLDTGLLVPESRPSLLDFRLSQIASMATLPFSCRAFESPDQNGRELAVWCMVVGGEALFDPTSSEWDKNSKRESRAMRRTIAEQFWDATRNRLAVRGIKQFIRYSIPFRDDWRSALEDTQPFASLWLATR